LWTAAQERNEKAGSLHVNQLSSPPSATPSNIGKSKIS
jgi:hypothetical protein